MRIVYQKEVIAPHVTGEAGPSRRSCVHPEPKWTEVPKYDIAGAPFFKDYGAKSLLVVVW